jgi:hypothetical protein
MRLRNVSLNRLLTAVDHDEIRKINDLTRKFKNFKSKETRTDRLIQIFTSGQRDVFSLREDEKDESQSKLASPPKRAMSMVNLSALDSGSSRRKKEEQKPKTALDLFKEERFEHLKHEF